MTAAEIFLSCGALQNRRGHGRWLPLWSPCRVYKHASYQGKSHCVHECQDQGQPPTLRIVFSAVSSMAITPLLPPETLWTWWSAISTMAWRSRDVRHQTFPTIYIQIICNAEQEFENDQDRAKCFWCWKWVSWRQAIPTSWTVVTLSSATLLKMKILWLLKLVMSLSPFKLSQVEKNMFLHKRKLKTEYTNKKK